MTCASESLAILMSKQANSIEYDTFISLISQSESENDIDTQRRTFMLFSSVFPLSSSLWLQWLHIETNEVFNSETLPDYESLFELMDRAVKDYQSVDVWVFYVQTLTTALENGYLPANTSSKESALSNFIDRLLGPIETVLLSFSSGGQVVMALLEALSTICPTNIDLPLCIYKHALSTPYSNYETVHGSFLSFIEEQPNARTKSEELEAVAETMKTTTLPEYWIFWKKIQQQQSNSVPTLLNTLQQYILFVQRQSFSSQSHIIAAFDETTEICCLTPSIWLDYYRTACFHFNDRDIADSVLDRCIRNVPWSGLLWSELILAAESEGAPMKDIEALVARSMSGSLNVITEDLSELDAVFCAYARSVIRRAKAAESPINVAIREVDIYRMTRAKLGGPLTSSSAAAWPQLQLYLASCEVVLLKDFNAAQDRLSTHLFANGVSRSFEDCVYWMNSLTTAWAQSSISISILRSQWDNCLSLIEHKSIQPFAQLWLNWEAIHGDSLSYEEAQRHIHTRNASTGIGFHLGINTARNKKNTKAKAKAKAKAKEKEKKPTKLAEGKGKEKEKQGKKRKRSDDDDDGHDEANMKVEGGAVEEEEGEATTTQSRKKKPKTSSTTTKVASSIRINPKATRRDIPSPVLYVAPIPWSYSLSDFERLAQPYGSLQSAVLKNGFGFLHFSSVDDAVKARKGLEGTLLAADGGGNERRLSVNFTNEKGVATARPARSSEANTRTVFISNLSFKLDEESLKEILSETVPIKSIKLLANRNEKIKSAHRGSGFVELENEGDVQKLILKWNQVELKGRVLDVSKYKDNKDQGTTNKDGKKEDKSDKNETKPSLLFAPRASKIKKKKLIIPTTTTTTTTKTAADTPTPMQEEAKTSSSSSSSSSSTSSLSNDHFRKFLK